jgi:hypothetical protein
MLRLRSAAAAEAAPAGAHRLGAHPALFPLPPPAPPPPPGPQQPHVLPPHRRFRPPQARRPGGLRPRGAQRGGARAWWWLLVWGVPDASPGARAPPLILLPRRPAARAPPGVADRWALGAAAAARAPGAVGGEVVHEPLPAVPSHRPPRRRRPGKPGPGGGVDGGAPGGGGWIWGHGKERARAASLERSRRACSLQKPARHDVHAPGSPTP